MTTATVTSSLVADEHAVLTNPHPYRMLTGDRPTGPLHLGHYLGTLQNRVRLQNAGLLEMGASCEGTSSRELAEQIGDAGAAALKARVTEAVNEHLRPFRSRRAELAANPDVVADVLCSGAQRANEIADRTLQTVHDALGMTYLGNEP